MVGSEEHGTAQAETSLETGVPMDDQGAAAPSPLRVPSGHVSFTCAGDAERREAIAS